MKKLILSVFVILGCSGMGFSDTRGIPSGHQTDLATADYGGVDSSSICFTSNNRLCFTGRGVIQGFIASSAASTNDFLIFRDTGSVIASDTLTTDEIFRVHFSSNPDTVSTYGLPPGKGTTWKPPFPIKVKRGLAVKCNVATMENITILWTKFSE